MFLCTNWFIWREIIASYVFEVILIFMLPLDHAVDKMSVNHANEILKNIMNSVLFQISDFGFS